MRPEEVESIVAGGLPGARVEASDLTGTGDHWHLRIAWAGFAELSLLEQHRRVLEVLRPHMEGEGGSGRIHAVQIDTESLA